VSVTISTDDRTVTGTSLTEEVARAARELALSPSELAAIALNAFDRAFATASVIAPLRAKAAQAWDAWRMSAIS
jgi:adenosine deaminase